MGRGIVGVLLAKKIQNTLNVNTFLMTCRILGRKVEEVVLSGLKKYCSGVGIDIIIMHFKPTLKNRTFIEFLFRTEWVKDDQTNTSTFLIKEKKQAPI